MKPENPHFAPTDSVNSGFCAMNGKGNHKVLKLTLEAARRGTTVVLHCEGRIVSRSEANALSGIIAEVLPSAMRMVVDLEGVLSLDSNALGDLVMSHMWAEASGLFLTFASPSDAVRKLLESTSLDTVLDVFPSVNDALSAMHPAIENLA